jgi:hypothetical protein
MYQPLSLRSFCWAPLDTRQFSCVDNKAQDSQYYSKGRLPGPPDSVLIFFDQGRVSAHFGRNPVPDSRGPKRFSSLDQVKVPEKAQRAHPGSSWAREQQKPETLSKVILAVGS